MKPFPLDYADYVSETIEVLHHLDLRYIQDIADEIYNCWKDRTTLYICGNGGSSSVASHAVVDFSKGLSNVSKQNHQGIKCICLTDNVPTLTAWSNDNVYTYALSDSLLSVADSVDTLLVFSGSGTSKNIVNVVQSANTIGIKTLGVCGFGGGDLNRICKSCVVVPSSNMQICEDVFSMILHMIYCDLKNTLSK